MSFLSTSEEVFSKRKEFAPSGSKFFPFRADSFPEGVWCAGKQKGSHLPDVSLVKRIVGILSSVSSLLEKEHFLMGVLQPSQHF